MEKPDDFEVMSLRDLRQLECERGYAMAALLVALAIMAILLSIAMPVWRHEAQREKEAELVFRGEQYARAIALFRFKNANIPNAFPASIDSLVEGRFLRKKYKDPMTKDGEFALIGLGSAQPGLNQPPAQGGRGGSPTQPQGQQVVPGMTGVRSKSEQTSIRSYRGATRYDQWQFTFNVANRPGGAMPMANSPDGRGGNAPPGANFPGGVQPGNRGGTRMGPDGRPTSPGGRGPGGFGPGGGSRPGGTQPPFEPGTGNRGVGPGPSGRGRGF
jgi:type II secretory pathway pseudopilin PulG